jgi:glycosyltransferase involved in cell wall biosynthesis
MRIAILIDWYLPGYRAGGPIQSVHHLVQALRDEYAFFILTTDHDHGSAAPYGEVSSDRWVRRPDGSQVYYFSETGLTRAKLFALLDEGQFDWIYLQSMYSQPFARWPLQWYQRRRSHTQLLLAPRGMLQAGAMQQGYWKKRLYLLALHWLGLMRGVVFQATDAQEVADIRHYFGARAPVRLASNLPRQTETNWQPLSKTPGQVRWVFSSRIHPKKNLPHLLCLMPQLQGNIQLDLFGAIEGETHRAELEKLIAALPSGQEVRFMGTRPPAELLAALSDYHFAVLPTRGENFGHAIFEAMLAGLPVIISDQTPWRDLSHRQLGWDLPLAQKPTWLDALQQSIDMDDATYRRWSQSAWQFARQYQADHDLIAQSRALFHTPE